MKIEAGTEYHISEEVKRNFNSADAMKVIRQAGQTIQFQLLGKKGHGSMPVLHLQYLLKKNFLSEKTMKRQLLISDHEEEQIV